MILLRERLARLLQKQHRGTVETWEETTEFRQSQYLEKADEIIELFTNAIKNLEFSPNNLSNIYH